MTARLCGKVRGRVLQNRDPQNLARLQLEAPDLTTALGAALPDRSDPLRPAAARHANLDRIRARRPGLPDLAGFFWG